jgi:hypothetical protein
VPAMPELEISWASKERDELEEDEYGKKLKTEPELILSEPNKDEREREYVLMNEKIFVWPLMGQIRLFRLV